MNHMQTILSLFTACTVFLSGCSLPTSLPTGAGDTFMEDLDQALLLGLTMAVDDLSRKKMVLHPNSVSARDYLKGRLP